MPRDSQNLRRRMAAAQFGYFTAQQAPSAGYPHQAQKYHADRRNWLRVYRGVLPMRYESQATLRTGLEARLPCQSRESGVDLGRLQRRVIFERLLARLVRTGDAAWVLNGGTALEIRMADAYIPEAALL